jgi:DNA ligase D-like protein (predicted ligase)
VRKSLPPRGSNARFIEPMLLLAAETLPEGLGWTYELKLDGYRAIGVKTDGEIRLRSRNDKDFNRKYPTIVLALAALPDDTVVDGEVVALDEAGRPSFNALQNGSAGATIVYYLFDVMVLGGRNVMGETLATRRELLSREVLPLLADPVREAPRFDAALADLIAAVRAQGLEGLVAKRLDSVYEPGVRSGAWRKMRLNRSEEFVIGGYTSGGQTFDSLVLGRYEGDRLVYVARTRVGFTPASRERLMAKLRPLEIAKCPFANLPEARGGRWGEGLTAEKMKECVWVRPELLAEVEFVEWTPDGHLRHARFADEGRERWVGLLKS